MIIEEVTKIEVNCEPHEIDILSKCIVFLDNLLEKMSNQKFEWVFCEFEGDSRNFSIEEIAEIKNKLEWLQFTRIFLERS